MAGPGPYAQPMDFENSYYQLNVDVSEYPPQCPPFPIYSYNESVQNGPPLVTVHQTEEEDIQMRAERIRQLQVEINRERDVIKMREEERRQREEEDEKKRQEEREREEQLRLWNEKVRQYEEEERKKEEAEQVRIWNETVRLQCEEKLRLEEEATAAFKKQQEVEKEKATAAAAAAAAEVTTLGSAEEEYIICMQDIEKEEDSPSEQQRRRSQRKTEEEQHDEVSISMGKKNYEDMLKTWNEEASLRAVNEKARQLREEERQKREKEIMEIKGRSIYFPTKPTKITKHNFHDMDPKYFPHIISLRQIINDVIFFQRASQHQIL